MPISGDEEQRVAGDGCGQYQFVLLILGSPVTRRCGHDETTAPALERHGALHLVSGVAGGPVRQFPGLRCFGQDVLGEDELKLPARPVLDQLCR